MNTVRNHPAGTNTVDLSLVADSTLVADYYSLKHDHYRMEATAIGAGVMAAVLFVVSLAGFFLYMVKRKALKEAKSELDDAQARILTLEEQLNHRGRKNMFD
jgi:hypothetical protein